MAIVWPCTGSTVGSIVGSVDIPCSLSANICMRHPYSLPIAGGAFDMMIRAGGQSSAGLNER